MVLGFLYHFCPSCHQESEGDKGLGGDSWQIAKEEGDMR